MMRDLRFGLATLFAALLVTPATAGSSGAALNLPGAGPVADVAQTGFRDGFAQRITFAGGQRGVAEVTIRNGGNGSSFGSAVSMTKPSRSGIAAELRARFPGEVMRVVTTAHSNAYGPVGLALGSDCLFAWQWIDMSAGRAGARRRPNAFFGDSTETAASVRIKLCRTGTATVADLAASVERMTLSTDPETARVAQERAPRRVRRASAPARPPAPNPEAAATDAPGPGVPDGRMLGASAPGAMDRPGTEAPKAVSARRAAPERAVEAQRYVLPPPTSSQPSPIVPAPAPAVSGQAPRYITDASPGLSNPMMSVPKPAPNRTEMDDILAKELPARAYRPPP
ncbi:cellulose biosynthesis protein BcsN [Methylobacterium sp. BTF04]|uniref:cellulose biosynthesis protein BcsN n=1 Tax=Methylobacterium sp. BTF04 TaxID=2708300 RepID=UPI0013D83D97|nr:cellulose biosynthesis protein BcsN [Methylobacterium sp. BTF04]NEU11894.1 cellulose biosynthesis protein BcsN [Methylobacterium sp. BTF04]